MGGFAVTSRADQGRSGRVRPGVGAGCARCVRGAALGALTGLVVAGVDSGSALRAHFAGQRGALVLYVFALVVPTVTAAGLALAAWSHVCAHRWSGAWLRGACVGLPIAAFVAWVPSGWIAEHWDELTAKQRALALAVEAALVLGTLASGRCLLFLAQWLSPRSWLRRLAAAAVAVAATLAAAAAYHADLTLYPGDYADFHVGLAGLFVGAVASGVAALRSALAPPAPRRWLPRAALGVAAALAITLVALETSRLDAFGPSRALVFHKLILLVRHGSDLDGDGYASVLGGRDCAPIDPSRSPAAPELPENGIDEDCSGADERWPAPPPRPRAPRPDSPPLNVLLITVDALRADHLGSYGYHRKTSPNLDRLAAESLVFLRAFAQATRTWESLPSVFTGRYPSQLPRDYHHRRVRHRKPYFYYLEHDALRFPERFRAAGYATSAVVTMPLLYDTGLDRGFRLFKVNRDPLPKARKILAAAKTPFLLWLHLNRPHAPYEKDPRHDFGDTAIDRYDSEIATEDARIGKLLDLLKRRELAASTVVIVSADHGEEFGDHGGRFHTRKFYRELLHVPLIVRVPGLAPARISEVVEHVDLFPTLLELCGLPAPATPLDGQSLLATLDGPRPPEFGGAFGEDVSRDHGVKKRTFFDGRWRFIDDDEFDRFELYDTALDPTEQHDVSFAHPDVVRALLGVTAVRALRGGAPPASSR